MDPTIAESFNTYRITDYKEKVIELLRMVCTVCVEIMRLVGRCRLKYVVARAEPEAIS